MWLLCRRPCLNTGGVGGGEQRKEEEEGDIPDEFLDPVLATLMSDPVILTTSGVTLDRTTIVSHLLNDKTDPFNRKPLTMEQVLPGKLPCVFA